MEIIMSINHMTITKVPCNSDRIYDAADLLTHFASDLEKNSNAIFTAFGKVISGQDSGDLLALSMFQSMDDVEQSFERMDQSDHFAMMQDRLPNRLIVHVPAQFQSHSALAEWPLNQHQK